MVAWPGVVLAEGSRPNPKQIPPLGPTPSGGGGGQGTTDKGKEGGGVPPPPPPAQTKVTIVTNT